MAFAKKIIILNEVAKGYGRSELRGLATVEKSGDKAVCRLTVFNLGDVKLGNFLFGIKSRNLRLQKFELTQTSQNFPLDRDTDVDGVISCILVCKYTDRAVPLMWGSTDGKRIFEGNMTDGFMEPGRSAPPAEPASPAQPVIPAPAAPPVIPSAAPVPEVPYAAPADGDAGSVGEPAADGLSAKEAAEEEALPQKTVSAAGRAAAGKGASEIAASEYEDYAVAAENFYPADYGETAPEIKAGPGAPPANGNADEEPHAPPSGGMAGGKFYTAIKSQLDELFESYPKEEYLCSRLSGTDWVKVDYDNNGQYYTVGIITEDGRVKYICYGVPGKYAKNPPPELKGFCQWLPFNADNPEGEGYWMMYQDAENGKSVTLEII